MRRTLIATVVASLAVASCKHPVPVEVVLCLFSGGFSEPPTLTVNAGSSAPVTASVRASDGCRSNDVLSTTITITSANPAIATATASKPNREATGAPVSSLLTVNGIAPGQTTLTAQFNYPAGSSPSPITIPVTVLATTGDVRVVINGLPAGVNGNVDVGSALTTLKNYTTTATQAFPPATYSVVARNVTAPDGKAYIPTPSLGSLTVTQGQTTTYTVTYAAQVASTGTLQIQVAGNLPAGTNPDILVTGPSNFSRALTGATTIADLPPGTYTVATREVVTTNRDFGAAPGTATQTATVSVGASSSVTSTYVTLRRAVQVSMTGVLAPGVETVVQFTQGGTTVTATNTAGTVKLPLGDHTVAAPDRTVTGRTYRVAPGLALTLNVPDASTPLIIAVAFYLALEQFDFQAQMAILADPYGHAPFVQMWAARLIVVMLTYPFVPAGFAAQSTNVVGAMEVTGPAPFVHVTGNLLTDRTFTLTGNSGSTAIAGYTNVAARMTGSLSTSRQITNGTFRLGQTTAPTGLPSGPIDFTLTGAPAAMSSRMDSPPRRK